MGTQYPKPMPEKYHPSTSTLPNRFRTMDSSVPAYPSSSPGRSSTWMRCSGYLSSVSGRYTTLPPITSPAPRLIRFGPFRSPQFNETIFKTHSDVPRIGSDPNEPETTRILTYLDATLREYGPKSSTYLGIGNWLWPTERPKVIH